MQRGFEPYISCASSPRAQQVGIKLSLPTTFPLISLFPVCFIVNPSPHLRLHPLSIVSKVYSVIATVTTSIQQYLSSIPSREMSSQRQGDGSAARSQPQIRPCRYKVGKTLGAGSYSVVKECVHIDTGRYYAAKVINKRLMAGREHMVRLSLPDPTTKLKPPPPLPPPKFPMNIRTE